MARRQHLTLMVLLGVFAFFSLTWLMSGSDASADASPAAVPAAVAPKQKPLAEEVGIIIGGGGGSDREKGAGKADFGLLPAEVLTGGAIAPKLENKTLKAELGRASWKLFHTMMARFPEAPTPDDSLALKTYVQLFARLYPCGDCASHFQKLLAKYPPQTSSRNAAAGWACFVHNEVNKRLHHPIFDCNKIGDFYDCGCGEEGKDGQGKGPKAGGDAKDGAGDLKERKGEGSAGPALDLEKEGLTRGG